MTIATLTADWPGDPPLVGFYLKAARGRTAYEIVAVQMLKPGRYRLRVARHSPADVPAGATVCEWRWNTRKRR